MIVQCAACQTRFKIADEKVTDRGVKVRCTKCANTFVVRRDGPAPAPDAPPVAAAARSAAAGRAADPFAGTKGATPSGDPFAPVTKAGSVPPDPFAALGPPKPPPSLEQATNPGLFLGDMSDYEDDDSAFKEVTRVGVSLAHIQATRLDAPVEPITTPKQTPAIPPAAALPDAPDPFASFRLDAAPPAAPAPANDPFGSGLSGSDPFALKSPPGGDGFSLGAAAQAADPFGGLGAPQPAADPFAAAAPQPDPFGGAPAGGDPDPFGSGAFDFGGGLDLGGPERSAESPAGGPAPFGQTSRAEFDFGASMSSGLDLDPGGGAPAPGAIQPPVERPTAPPAPAPKAEPRAAAPAPVDAPAESLIHPRSPAAAKRKVKRRSTASALLNALVYALIGAGLLAAVFVAQNDGTLSLSELSVETALKTLAGKGAGDYPVRSVSNGLYETRTGRPVFYVRGQVENRTDSSRQLRVQVELVSGGVAARRTDGVAGALPSPEELYELTDAASSTLLRDRLARRGVPVEPGGTQEFLVVFYEFPDNLPDLKLRITAEPFEALAAAAPPAPVEPAQPATPEAAVAAANEPEPKEEEAVVTGSRRKRSKSKPVPPLPDFSKEPPRKLLINSGKPGATEQTR